MNVVWQDTPLPCDRRITDNQREAEDQINRLQHAGGPFVAAAERSRLPMVFSDPRLLGNPIVYANDAFLRLTGYERDEVLGRNYHFMISPDADPAVTEAIIESLQQDVFNGHPEALYTRKDGTKFWATIFISPVFDDGGVVQHFASFIDATERKRTQEELVQANARLAREMELVQNAYEVMQSGHKMEAIGRLTGGIAHDFNNLLTIVAGNLDLLLTRLPGESAEQRFVSTAQRAVFRGAKLIEQLLSFARQQDLHPEVCDLNQLIEDQRILVEQAAGSNVDVRFNRELRLKPTLVDPTQFQSVILNLVMNAHDAMAQGGGTLTIETYNDDHHIVVAITDTGHGMSDAVRERAFEPFFTTKSPGDGSGLGLSQVYGFAQQSGGDVVIESSRGHGTTVRLHLPRLRASQQLEAPQGGKTVLVVEDDPLVLETVVATLSSLGYSTLAAQTGSEAIAVLTNVNNTIDLLFTDLVMPGGMSGFDVAHEATKLRPGLRVLLTSGYQDSRNDGNHDYPVLKKPYRAFDLVKKFAEVL